MPYSAEERIRELEAELASARAEVAELHNVINRMSYTPMPAAQNAALEGADAPDDSKDAA